MSVTVTPAIEDVSFNRVDIVRSSWIDNLDFMVRGSDPLVNTVYCRLAQISEKIAAQQYDTPEIVILTTSCSGSKLAILIDLFVNALKMYHLRSVQFCPSTEQSRYVLTFELRDNNDQWIVDEMKRMYKEKIRESLKEDNLEDLED